MAPALADVVARGDGHPGSGRPVLVGFSGGLDSSVLLHLLAHDPTARAAGLRAVHIHHGLHPDADAWALHCEGVCAALDVPAAVVHVTVDRASGLGYEGAARDARHHAFAAALGTGDVLALAHHLDDQAETFLLRALRGSGIDGLAAMRTWRAFADGWLWRPLLDTPRDALMAHARAHGLRWIEDPGNADGGLDRGFLRHQLMPLLRARWPHADAMFARSATLAAQSADLLLEEDAAALVAAHAGNRSTLHLKALQRASPERRARVLRHWITTLGLPPLPAQGVARIEADLLQASADAAPRFDWHGARIQRWRDLLHAGMLRAPLPSDWQCDWNGSSPLELPGGDRLELLGASGFGETLRAHARRGGERIRLSARPHSHTLKHVLQAEAMPPWQRERLPLLSRGETLLAAGDRILSGDLASWLDARSARLRWTALA